jgi:hypothetical protein
LPGIGIDVSELATQNQVKLNDARKNPIFPKKKSLQALDSRLASDESIYALCRMWVSLGHSRDSIAAESQKKRGRGFVDKEK